MGYGRRYPGRRNDCDYERRGGYTGRSPPYAPRQDYWSRNNNQEPYHGGYGHWQGPPPPFPGPGYHPQDPRYNAYPGFDRRRGPPYDSRGFNNQRGVGKHQRPREDHIDGHSRSSNNPRGEDIRHERRRNTLLDHDQRASVCSPQREPHDSRENFPHRREDHQINNLPVVLISNGSPRDAEVFSGAPASHLLHAYSDDDHSDSNAWDKDWEPCQDILSTDATAATGTGPSNNSLNDSLLVAMSCLGLESAPAIHIEARLPVTPDRQVATAPLNLTQIAYLNEGTYDGPEGALTRSAQVIPFCMLQPTLDTAPNHPVQTLAQEFIRNSTKQWWSGQSPHLHSDLYCCDKLLIWARAMLMSEPDRKILEHAGVARGILASLFEIKTHWPLVQAFITFWNRDGHTLVSTLGEMGFSLLDMADSMGIPISGRAYEENIPTPLPGGTAGTLFSVYGNLCRSKVQKGTNQLGLVTISKWISQFVGDLENLPDIPEAPEPPGFFASIEDPLLKEFGFRVVNSDKVPSSVYFSNCVVRFSKHFSREENRAAFIAAWICTYCLPINKGAFIRPEVFVAASSIASGIRRGIGVASLAYLYDRLDAVYSDIVNRSGSSSECSLSIPTHFIMGWFSSHWKQMPTHPSFPSPFTSFPPFVTEVWKIAHFKVSLHEAHRLFLDTEPRGKSLQSLEFMGRSNIRLPIDSSVYINDSRDGLNGSRSIRISEVDMLVSCTVGGIAYRRCQFQNNQVYCPHRFAMAHGCDQGVPDFSMGGTLDFGYLNGTLEETTEILRRRLLAYWRPAGHNFEMLSSSEERRRSYEYMRWCQISLDFLKESMSFCVGIEAPADHQKQEVACPAPLLSTLEGVVMNTSQADDVGVSEKNTNIQNGISDVVCGLAATGKDLDINSSAIQEAKSKQTTKGNSRRKKSAAAAEKNLVVDDGVTQGNQDQQVATSKGSSEKRKNTESLSSNPMKKTCKENSSSDWDFSHQLSEIQSSALSIEKQVQGFLEQVGDAFEAEALRPKQTAAALALRIPESANPQTKFLFKGIKMDVESLQKLATATEFDEQNFIHAATSTLEGWESFSSLLPPEITDLVARMKAIKEGKGANRLTYTVEDLTISSTQVGDMLDEAVKIQNQISTTLGEVNNFSASKVQHLDSLAFAESQSVAKISKLEEQLKQERGHLEVIQKRNAQLKASCVGPSEQSIKNLSLSLAESIKKGESFRKEVESRLRDIEHSDDFEGPGPALRSLIQSLII